MVRPIVLEFSLSSESRAVLFAKKCKISAVLRGYVVVLASDYVHYGMKYSPFAQ